MSDLGVDALNRLPVGAVLIARHKWHRDIAVWVKTDDTELMDDDGERAMTAWMSPTYIADRTAETLTDESSSIRLIYDASHDGDMT